MTTRCPGAASAPKSLAAWDAFVTQVVKRYKGRITAYQIWNEASLVMFWDGTPEAMAELTKRAYDIIKEEDPKARVVAASTTVRLAGAFDRFFPSYLAALAELDWPVDVFAAHMYPNEQGHDGRASGLHHPGRPTRWRQPVHPTCRSGTPSSTTDWPDRAPSTRARASRERRRGTGSSRPRSTRSRWASRAPTGTSGLLSPTPCSACSSPTTPPPLKGLRIVNQWIVGGTTTGCTDDGSVTSCPVEKNGVPSVIAWADDETGTLAPPAGMTQVCTTANRCSPIDGPLEITETPVRLLP